MALFDERLPLSLVRLHGSTLQGMGRLALRATLPGKVLSGRTAAGDIDVTPLHKTVAAPPNKMVDAYCRWAGARGLYPNSLPPHLVSQWGLAPVSQLLLRTPYSLPQAINQGFSLRLYGKLPRNTPLKLRASFEQLERQDGLDRISVMLTTGIEDNPRLLETVFHMAFATEGKTPPKRSHEQQPERQWHTVGQWSATKKDAINFALLTGDFNPIHWFGPAGKASLFGKTVLHGFGMLVRTYEQLSTQQLHDLDMRFINPVPLPSEPLLVQHTEADVLGERRLRLIGNDGTLHLAGRYRCR